MMLHELLSAARRCESALIVALHVGDETAAAIAAGRLRLLLIRAKAIIDGAVTAMQCARAQDCIRATFDRMTRTMRDLERCAPRQARDIDTPRLTRWMLAPRNAERAKCSPDLFELDATGVALDQSRFDDLHLMACRLMTRMHAATFSGAFIEQSDFVYGDLQRTLWEGTTVHRSYFRDSSLVDASLNGTTFVECDLRGVSLAVEDTRARATWTNVEFRRCDLRGVNWQGRQLSEAKLVDCRTAYSEAS